MNAKEIITENEIENPFQTKDPIEGSPSNDQIPDSSPQTIASDTMAIPESTAASSIYATLQSPIVLPDNGLKNVILEKLINEHNGIKISFQALGKQLDLHPRTLQRRLKKEGTCYNQLKDQARFTLAKQYLTHTKHSIEQIADQLDFTERTSFTRAFKRWTGQTPMQYRKHQNMKKLEEISDEKLEASSAQQPPSSSQQKYTDSSPLAAEKAKENQVSDTEQTISHSDAFA